MSNGENIKAHDGLLEQCNVAIMVAKTTPEGLVVTECNEANARMTGYSRDELIGSRPDDTTLAADTDMQSMHRAMRSARQGESGIFASRFRRKDGKAFAVRSMITGRYGEDGKLSHYVFVSTPINPDSPGLRWFGTNGLLAQAEQASGTGAWRFELETEELICSDNCYALFGLSPGEDMIARLLKLLPSSEKEKIRKAIRQCQQDGQASHTSLSYYRDDGSRRDAQISVRPECDQKGHLAAIIGVLHDVTQLRVLQRKQAMFLGAARIGFLEVDMAASLIRYSAETAKLMGLGDGPGTISVESWKGHVHPDDLQEAWASYLEHVKNEKSFVRRYRFLVEGGAYHWMEVRAAARTEPGRDSPTIYSTITDIDDQVRADEELAQVRFSLDLAIDAAGLGLWNWDLRQGAADGAMTWSAHMRHILGLDEEARASWQALESLIHPDDLQQVSEIMLAATSGTGGGEFTIEHRFVRADGQIVWVENRGLARQDAQKRVIGIAGALLDITKRKRAEADMVRSEQRFHDVAAITGECIFELNGEGNFVYLSGAAQRIYGYQPEEMLGRCPLEFTPKHQRAYQDWITKARQAHGWNNVEREVIRKDGSIGWITVNGRAFFNDNGTVAGFRGAIADTTERHDFVEQLLQSKRRANDVLRIADGCMFDLDTEGFFTFVSDNSKRLFGAEGQDLIGKPTFTLAPELRPRHHEWLEAIRTSDGGLESEIRMSPLNDQPDIWMRTICRVLTDDAGTVIGYRGIALNVTARKQATEQIIRAKKAAEAAAEERARFLSTMSHEIRTPLNAVIGMTGLLLDMEQPDEQKRLTLSANHAGKHLLGLVNDILDFSKLDADKLEVEQTGFVLQDEVETVRDMLAPGAEEKGLALEINISREAQGGYIGDPARIRQILVNLVGNAIKFTTRGHVRVDVKRGKKGCLRFAVLDTGVGISQAALPDLFQDFAQADSSITRRFGGTGLGLAICKRLTALMGGHIGVDSKPGKGSTFWFEIPLKDDKSGAGKTAGTAAPAEPGKDQQWHLHVLVAEDNPANQMLIKTILSRMGHEIMVVGNGALAVEAATSASFDLILMDVQMPEMDGVTATRRLRDKGCETPIIALTAHVITDEKDRFAAAGMDAWLSKPFDARTLAQTMYRCTRQKPVAGHKKHQKKSWSA